MFLLLKRIRYNGEWVYTISAKSPGIYLITEEIKKRVKDGCPVRDLMVVEEMPFEFKCAVKYGEDLLADAK